MTASSSAPSQQLLDTLAAFDKANDQDPNRISLEGKEVGKELLYGRRMSTRLALFDDSASEALQLAVRAQHIQRWKIARTDFVTGLKGYNQWRQAQAKNHAQIAGDIMAKHNYSPELIERVQSLLQKKQLKQDPEAQTLEDIACLVFLEHYIEDFVSKNADTYDEAKLISIIQKTWRKMSESGHAAALELPLAAPLLALIQKALAP